jgi:dephospho-CoA kinase
MIVLGLTGSIGMGKSTTAQLFAQEGAPVYDADAAVHALYEPGGAAVGPVGAAFPGVVKDGAIDRAALSKAVLDDPDGLKRLESIVHPLVREAQASFLGTNLQRKFEFVVLDIPLLFETGADKLMDAVVVVSAPADVQRARVLSRPGMSVEKFEAILSKQSPDADKRAKADFVVNTGLGIEEARAQVRAILSVIREDSLAPAGA